MTSIFIKKLQYVVLTTHGSYFCYSDKSIAMSIFFSCDLVIVGDLYVSWYSWHC